jgi:hypothetical protein
VKVLRASFAHQQLLNQTWCWSFRHLQARIDLRLGCMSSQMLRKPQVCV